MSTIEETARARAHGLLETPGECVGHCSILENRLTAYIASALSREAEMEKGAVTLAGLVDRVKAERDALRAEVERLQRWVADLQSGMYVNCVYCGHRYGPGETTPVSMADALKAHVEACPSHPMSALRSDLTAVRGELVRVEGERDHLLKLFDDAGQGEHNVLALVDHYQDAAMAATERERRLREALEYAHHIANELAKAAGLPPAFDASDLDAALAAPSTSTGDES
jgi:hypothetical protein